MKFANAPPSDKTAAASWQIAAFCSPVLLLLLFIGVIYPHSDRTCIPMYRVGTQCQILREEIESDF